MRHYINTLINSFKFLIKMDVRYTTQRDPDSFSFRGGRNQHNRSHSGLKQNSHKKGGIHNKIRVQQYNQVKQSGQLNVRS